MYRNVTNIKLLYSTSYFDIVIEKADNNEHNQYTRCQNDSRFNGFLIGKVAL